MSLLDAREVTTSTRWACVRRAAGLRWWRTLRATLRRPAVRSGRVACHGSCAGKAAPGGTPRAGGPMRARRSKSVHRTAQLAARATSMRWSPTPSERGMVRDVTQTRREPPTKTSVISDSEISMRTACELGRVRRAVTQRKAKRVQGPARHPLLPHSRSKISTSSWHTPPPNAFGRILADGAGAERRGVRVNGKRLRRRPRAIRAADSGPEATRSPMPSPAFRPS